MHIHLNQSPLQSRRVLFSPELPKCFEKIESLCLKESDEKCSIDNEISPLFPYGSTLHLVKRFNSSIEQKRPLKIGVVFSGGQAPGGHNVITGLLDSLKKLNANSELIGFLGGPAGLISGTYKMLFPEDVQPFRNSGGFDLLGSGRTKIETSEQFEQALNTCQSLLLDGLVIIGGDDSNTNAAVLAEYFHEKKCSTCVVGIPKTIDGDLKNQYAAVSFGFDTASRVYAELIGNLQRDCLSAKKYYHFVRLMGRTASHIALECALLTHPNYTFISEEVLAKKMTLDQVVNELCLLVKQRKEVGKSYGVVLIPEGLIESIPEISLLIQELNAILCEGDVSTQEVLKRLTPASSRCFSSMPVNIQKQLLFVRDPHGNVQVSLIETERLLAEMVGEKLSKQNIDFSPIPHFFGYEGRSAFPSNFDASYCYSLGFVATLAISSSLSGYMCFLSHLQESVDNWDFGAVPLASLIQLEIRKGKQKPVIAKALVDLQGKPFSYFSNRRDAWKIEDDYRFPGPIQFDEKPLPPFSLLLEQR